MEIVLYDSRSPRAEPVCPEVPISSVSENQASLIIPASPCSYVIVAAPSSKRAIFRSLGHYLMILTAVGTIFASLPAIVPKIQSELWPKAEIPAPAQVTFEQVAKQKEINDFKLAAEEAQKYGVSTDFSIVIPKISATAKVIPNVNFGKEQEYRNALKLGVAHAVDTKFPGENGTIYLFAHSTNSLANVLRYNAIFYQLKDLGAGDKIILFYLGKRYVYQVLERQITAANDTKWLADNGEEKLVLQTCWPPGTSLKRLIIVAKPV